MLLGVVTCCCVAALGSRPRLTEAYSFLVDTSLVTRWFDIFDDLGIQKQVLNLSVRAHPFDASLSLFDMLKVWVEREEPPATWEALIHAIRYKLLEGKIADKMARRYCPQACSPNDPGMWLLLLLLCGGSQPHCSVLPDVH